jgi:adenosine kinase
LLSICPVLVVTDAEKGSFVYEAHQTTHVPTLSVEKEKAVDPTGCGDAYRAGLLFGLARGWGWVASARLGSVLGAIKVQSLGGQNHVVSIDQICGIYQDLFGQSLPL